MGNGARRARDGGGGGQQQASGGETRDGAGAARGANSHVQPCTATQHARQRPVESSLSSGDALCGVRVEHPAGTRSPLVVAVVAVGGEPHPRPGQRSSVLGSRSSSSSSRRIQQPCRRVRVPATRRDPAARVVALEGRRRRWTRRRQRTRVAPRPPQRSQRTCGEPEQPAERQHRTRPRPRHARRIRGAADSRVPYQEREKLADLCPARCRTTWTARCAWKRWTSPTLTSNLVRAGTRSAPIFPQRVHLLAPSLTTRTTPIDLSVLLSPHQGELEQPLPGVSIALRRGDRRLQGDQA